MERHRIYCSGPLFCAEEVGGMMAIAKELEDSGFQTFLPHRDGIEGYIMRFSNASLPSTVAGIRNRIDYAIFSLDVYELIERCCAVVCNLNGRVPDEGMIVEAALAYAAGKPLVFYKDDARAPFGGYDNSMLTSLVNGKIVSKIKKIPSAITFEMSQPNSLITPSIHIKKAISYGKRISAVLEKFPETLGKKQWSDKILSQVIDEALERE